MELAVKLQEIASSLNLNDVLTELEFIENRLKDANKKIIIPIVGEFSSGKTTLLNSLMDSKKLETASKPTTSVVYEIFFGQEEEYAEIIFEDGESQIIEDFSELKNDNFQNVSLVKIYDTSTKVTNSTILVDTPGLSSNDPKHIEALSNYLPNADALILCVDANQQITSSLLNFLKINNLAHLPVYIIITKSDTKTANDIQQIKDYISKSIDLPTENLISISSLKNELVEFFSLMDEIQKNKNQIVNNVLNFKLVNTKEYLKKYIVNLLDNSTSDKQIELKLKEQGRELDRLKNAIDKLIRDTHSELEDVEYNTINDFKKIIADKLDQVVSKKSPTADQEAISTINSTSSIVMSNYQNEIRRKLWEIANNRRNSESGIPLRSLEGIDVSALNIGPLSYDIDLSSAGQGTIKGISTGIKTIGIAAALVATAGLAAPAAAAGTAAVGAAGTVGTAAAGGIASGVAGAAITGARVAKIVKTASVINMATNTVKTINSKEFKENVKGIQNFDQQIGQIVGVSKSEGFVENIVGSVADSSLGKPQRKKMINDYLDSSLIPEFKSKLNNLTNLLLQDIQSNLNTEAQIKITQLENKLTELKDMYAKDIETFKKRMEDYKRYVKILNN